ncbi:hypothetical protein [Roseivirga sp. E12]|uniref:hypothetical protein n=1 Tax=Roseivirga sp. E12 TaxID=2819237 RepID=UPI001ABCEF15|nr:hypothetical protein [Roseivirga sp. E12]MBO3697523.1 hypothetical protein [Roseivirga sp. E12]
MNEIFSAQRRYWFLLLILLISLDASALRIGQSVSPFQDSLVIKKNNGKKTYVIKKGREIKIWAGRSTHRGALVEFKNDTLLINEEGAILKYSVSDISKIKIFENIEINIIGSALKIWGGALIVAGIVPPITLGPGGFIITVPAWAIGYGMYKIGGLISGNRKLNLKKKWRIQ